MSANSQLTQNMYALIQARVRNEDLFLVMQKFIDRARESGHKRTTITLVDLLIILAQMTNVKQYLDEIKF